MTQFLITYDNHPPRDYKALYSLLAVWKAVPLADSVWLANLNASAEVVRDFVAGALQHGDTVGVLELKPGSDWATIHVEPAASAWLSANVTPSKKAA